MAAPGAAGPCRVTFARDFTPVDDGSLDDDGHGSNVASIVSKVAPGAQILALDVFQEPYAFDSDVLSALDWVMENRASRNICALNLSFGGGGPYGPCATFAVARALDVLRKAGVLAAVAAGNEHETSGLSYPACAPAAVSVGAVYDVPLPPRNWTRDSEPPETCSDTDVRPDSVACFSNT